MDARNLALLAAVLVIGGFVVFSGDYAKIDAAREELAQAKEELESLEDELGEDAAEADAPASEAAKINQLVANYETLEAHKKELADAVLNLEGKKNASLKAFRDTVETVRSKSVGSSWTDVPYRNGQMLRGVRIQKVADTEVTLAHNEGVVRLRADELPAGLKERFRMGMEPFLSSSETQPAAMTSSLGSASKSTGSSKPARASSSPPAVSAATSQVSYIEEQLASTTAKINTAESSMSQWRNRASSLRGQASYAKVSGRPTYNLLQEAGDAEQKANAIELQLHTMRAEQSLLRQKLSTAKAEAVRAKNGSRR